MKRFDWDAEKNRKLMKERDVSFEDVVFYLLHGEILDDLDHPNQKKYPGQRMFILDIDEYAYLVPYVESDEEIFLKTIIPSRKATKIYLEESK